MGATWSRFGWVVALLGGALAGAPARAEEPKEPAAAQDEGEESEEEDEGPLPRFSGEAGLDVVNKYFFRGLLAEDKGLIVQPWVNLSLAVAQPGGCVGEIRVELGNWNSFHGGDTGADSPDADAPKAWYEADFFAGLGASVFDGFDLWARYQAYSSPNGSWPTQGEVILGASWDDSERWGCVLGRPFLGFQPWIELAAEVMGQSDGGADKGVWLGLGAEPGFALLGGEEPTLKLLFPLEVGFSLSEYYEDAAGDSEFFGYFQAGAKLEWSLGCVSPCLDAWKVWGSASVLFLGDHAAEYGDTDEVQFLLGAGIGVEF